MAARTRHLLVGVGVLVITANLVLRGDVLYETGSSNPRAFLVLVGLLYVVLGTLRFFFRRETVTTSVLLSVACLPILLGVSVALVYVGPPTRLSFERVLYARVWQVLQVAPIIVAYPLAVSNSIAAATRRRRYVRGFLGGGLLLWVLPLLFVLASGAHLFVVLYYVFVGVADIMCGFPLYVITRRTTTFEESRTALDS